MMASLEQRERELRQCLSLLGKVIEQLRALSSKYASIGNDESQLQHSINALLSRTVSDSAALGIVSEDNRRVEGYVAELQACASEDRTRRCALTTAFIHYGLAPLLVRLKCHCIFFAEAETQQGSPNVSQDGHTQLPKGTEAPPGILSLRDYSAVQAALEMVVCWGLYCIVSGDVGRHPRVRNLSRTLRISRALLCWPLRPSSREDVQNRYEEQSSFEEQNRSGARMRSGAAEAESCSDCASLASSYVRLVQSIVELPQFRAMLMPQYLVDVLTGLLWDQETAKCVGRGPRHTANGTTESKVNCLAGGATFHARFSATRELSPWTGAAGPTMSTTGQQQELVGQSCVEKLLSSVPLALAISILRTFMALTKARDSVSSNARAECGRLLCSLVVSEGGVESAIRVLLEAAPEGNSKVREKVAHLLCRIPKDMSAEKYIRLIGPQIVELLRAPITGVKESETALVARGVAVMMTHTLLESHRDISSLYVTGLFLKPLLAFNRPNVLSSEEIAHLGQQDTDGNVSTKSLGGRAVLADEDSISACIECLSGLVLGGPVPPKVVSILSSVLRPLVHLYSFAYHSKSYICPVVGRILDSLVRTGPPFSSTLHFCVLPFHVRVIHPGEVGTEEPSDLAKQWSVRSPPFFAAGGQGGVGLYIDAGEPSAGSPCPIVVPKSTVEQLLTADPDGFPLGVEDEEEAKRLAEAVLHLLSSDAFKNSDVPGTVFVNLLGTYLIMRRLDEAKRESILSHYCRAGERVVRHGELNGCSDTNTNTSHSALCDDSPARKSLAEDNAIPLELLAAGVRSHFYIYSLLEALIERMGPSLLSNTEQILQLLLSTLVGVSDQTEFARTESASGRVDAVAPHTSSESVSRATCGLTEDDLELATLCLGLLTTLVEAGASRREEAEEKQLRSFLPALTNLSQLPVVDVADMSTQLCASILSRGHASSCSFAETAQQQHSQEHGREISSKASTATRYKTAAEKLQEAKEDIASVQVPLRARGVVRLTKMVRRSRVDPSISKLVPELLNIYMDCLLDKESYVYLAAVQGLAALADYHPSVSIPALTDALTDVTRSLEQKIKLVEALTFAARRCGETLPTYALHFVRAFLHGARPQSKTTSTTVGDKTTDRVRPRPLIEEITPSQKNAQSEGKNGNRHRVDALGLPSVQKTEENPSIELTEDGSGGEVNEAHGRDGGIVRMRHASGGAVNEAYTRDGEGSETHESGGGVSEEYLRGGEVCEAHGSGEVSETHGSGGGVNEAHGSGGVNEAYEDQDPAQMFRASCLSSLAEVCALLGWSVQQYALDILTCVYGIIDMEGQSRERNDQPVIRGAVYILYKIVVGQGSKLLYSLPDQLKPMYHRMKALHEVSRDEVTRYHVEQSLGVLSDFMRSQLFGDAHSNPSQPLIRIR